MTPAARTAHRLAAAALGADPRRVLRRPLTRHQAYGRLATHARHMAWHALRRVTRGSYRALGEACQVTAETVAYGVRASTERAIESVEYEARLDAVVVALREAVS